MSRMIRGILLTLWSTLALGSCICEAATLRVPDDFPTIASALTEAANNTDLTDTIILKRGTYQETVVLIPNVILEGEEAARTFIDGNGTGTVITAASGSVIQRLTVTNGGIGIAIPDNTNGVTVNNVIITQQNGQGIQCSNASNPTITNNTLDGNGTAITCANSTSLVIKSNIITNNTTDISLDQLTLNNSPQTGRDFNDFFGNTNTPYVDANVRDSGGNITTHDRLDDPLFVNPGNNDFHLKAGSPAIGKGSGGVDIGAYGGSNADLTLFPVSNLRVTAQTSNSITVSWDADQAYNVLGYKVLHDSDQSGPPYANALCVGNVITEEITGLSGSVTPPPTPTNFSAGIGDGELQLSWSAVDLPSVAEYKIQYGTSPGVYNGAGSPIVVPHRNTTAYPLTNLVNLTPYYLVISAVAKPPFFITVTALDNTPSQANCPNPQLHESDLAPEAETFLSSPVEESSLSTEISATPEPIVRFPDLQNEGGCFIATAAYGSPLESHVQVLRTFRDRYLLPHMLGRKLVAVYYQVSPPLAHWLEEHEAFKPAVRALLFPVVMVTAFWMSITSIGKTLILGGVLFLIGIPLYRWRMSSKWGGRY